MVKTKLYQYTVLKQNGTTEVLEPRTKMELDDLYITLNCKRVELVPKLYYARKGFGRCIIFVDEEGRFNSSNKRNPHFNVLIEPPLSPEEHSREYDIVGNALVEQVYKP